METIALIFNSLFMSGLLSMHVACHLPGCFSRVLGKYLSVCVANEDRRSIAACCTSRIKVEVNTLINCVHVTGSPVAQRNSRDVGYD